MKLLTLLLCFTPISRLAPKPQPAAMSIGDSSDSRLSGNGRFMVFESTNWGLTTTASSIGRDYRQVYLKDQLTQTVRLISQYQNQPGNNHSFSPDISHDGRYIIFLSFATNFIDAKDGQSHLYLYDQALDQIVQIDQVDGKSANGSIKEAKISGNGAGIVFSSNSPTYSRSSYFQVYYYNLPNSILRLISGTYGKDGNGDSSNPQINYHGNRIVFESFAGNLTNNATYYANYTNIFLYEVVTNSLALISKDNTNYSGLGNSNYPTLSGDGRNIYFLSKASNITNQDELGIILGYNALTDTLTKFPLPLKPVGNLSLSGSGDLLAFTAFIESQVMERVFILNVFTNQLHPFGSEEKSNLYPHLSFDGIYITFTIAAGAKSEIIWQAVDNEPPVITYSGSQEIIIGTEYDYTEAIKVEDKYSTGISFSIIDNGGFDYMKLGTYLIVVEAIDEGGNSITYSFSITVIEECYPIYQGPKKINLRVNDQPEKLMNKLKFVDEKNNPLTPYLIDDGGISFSTLGRYQVIVGAVNKYDRETRITIEVNIVASVIGDFSLWTLAVVPAVIFLLGYFIYKYRRPVKTRKDSEEVTPSKGPLIWEQGFARFRK